MNFSVVPVAPPLANAPSPDRPSLPPKRHPLGIGPHLVACCAETQASSWQLSGQSSLVLPIWLAPACAPWHRTPSSKSLLLSLNPTGQKVENSSCNLRLSNRRLFAASCQCCNQSELGVPNSSSSSPSSRLPWSLWLLTGK